MSPNLKPVLLLALLCSAFVVLTPASALGATPAKTTVPCWKKLMNDWYSGKIKHTYAPACYTTAIKNLPTDLKIYSSARQDIEHALEARVAGKPIPPEAGTPPSTTPSTTTTSAAGPGTTTTTTPTTPPAHKKTGISLFFAKLTPGDPQAFPLPLLILGALAIVLVAAGVAGMLWQRSHPREDPPPA